MVQSRSTQAQLKLLVNYIKVKIMETTYKVEIKDVDHFVKVQNVLLSYGYRWYNIGTKIFRTPKAKTLLIKPTGSMVWGDKPKEAYPYPEVFIYADCLSGEQVLHNAEVGFVLDKPKERLPNASEVELRQRHIKNNLKEGNFVHFKGRYHLVTKVTEESVELRSLKTNKKTLHSMDLIRKAVMTNLLYLFTLKEIPVQD